MAEREGDDVEGASGSFQMQDYSPPPPPYPLPNFDGHNSFHSGGGGGGGGGVMVDYMLNNAMIPPFQQQQQQQSPRSVQPNNSNNNMSAAVERTLSFADVMQFAEFGPKLGLINHPQSSTGMDPVSFLKFPVLANKSDDGGVGGGAIGAIEDMGGGGGADQFSYEQHYTNPVQLEFLGTNANNTNNASTEQEDFIDDIIGIGRRDNFGLTNNMEDGGDGGGGGGGDGKSSNGKRKRPRTIKTTEEVESQRMTHIAVERNRRKQMNEHLRVLRGLMPSSYVQRGDQASIIGGAIEFVRELEQLLQCLESQKRRRLYGDPQPRPVAGDTSTSTLGLVQQPPPLGFPQSLPTLGQQEEDEHQMRQLVDDQLDPNNNSNNNDNEDNNCSNLGAGGETGLLMREETAESKSSIADVEVKVLGFDALIKILSRRRPGQLVKAIAALEDLRFTIIHTNITTIEQTVLYSFNVKVASEARFSAEDIANSIQQIFSFIHANTNII